MNELVYTLIKHRADGTIMVLQRRKIRTIIDGHFAMEMDLMTAGQRLEIKAEWK